MGLAALSPSRRRLLAAGLLFVVAAVLLLRHVGSGAARPAVAPLRPAHRAAGAARPRLVVDVVGAVRRPGLYRLRQGTRIADAVALAGGSTAKADLALVNLAAPLADGEQVVVPSRSPVGGATAATPPTAGASPTAPLDLNTGTAEQLDGLPGIGPATTDMQRTLTRLGRGAGGRATAAECAATQSVPSSVTWPTTSTD